MIKKTKHPKHPCRCSICESSRYWEPCGGCKDGHPSFWKTVIESPQWKLWQKEQKNRLNDMNNSLQGIDLGVYDMPEVEECGFISPKHFQDFIKFICSK